MNTLLITSALKLFGPKLVRAGLAALAGFGLTYGVSIDTSNVAAFVASIAMLFAVWVWSIFAKTTPDSTQREVMANAFHSAAALLVPGLIGWMQAKGVSVTDSTTIDVLGPLLLQVAASGLNKPDKTAKPKS